MSIKTRRRGRLDVGQAAKPLPRGATVVDRMKFVLCEQFVIYHNKKRPPLAELADRVGLSRGQVGEILHYRFGGFTIDQLIESLQVLLPNLELRMKVK